MALQIENFWKDFEKFSGKNDGICQCVKIDDQNGPTIFKLCHTSVLIDFIKEKNSEKIVKEFIIADSGKGFLAHVPKDSGYFINIFCCNFTMNKITSKISQSGFAIEGGFEIKYLENETFHLKGSNIDNGHAIRRDVKIGGYTNYSGIVLIEDYKNVKIMSIAELLKYKQNGVHLEYISGLYVYKDGNPLISTNQMKNISDTRSGSKILIDGANVKLDYDKQTVNITNSDGSIESIHMDDMEFVDEDANFDGIGFVNSAYFDCSGSLVTIVKDLDDNLIVLAFERLDLVALNYILGMINCRDAVVINDDFDYRAIWKSNAKYNYHNHIDFIGNPNELVANSIVFSK